jgi:hypothetical protein
MGVVMDGRRTAQQMLGQLKRTGETTMTVDEDVDECIRVTRTHGYFPTAFIRMRAERGTVSAIEELVVSGKLQPGFLRLKRLGLLRCSVEAVVLRHINRFTKNARQCAEFRLRLLRAS